MEIVQTIANYLFASAWSPYLVGVGIGILSWLAFLLSNHPIGVSTAFAKSAGMIEVALRGPKVRKKLYYQEKTPRIDWEWMLVLGLFLGAYTAAWLSGDINWKWVPGMWEETFGSNILLRLSVALFGGICVGFGARWGSGCTSGHGISGTMQLVLSSWIAVFCFFFGGVAVAFLLYRII
ncbi:YeeE/YedE thiosulfate transporter family protein [Desulfopila inferna]|uniref:YeeE/YedE thiosulfate transporter family protein n=1 Tax=Desulfopila inferna TaxID=468528 RepID=UPI001962C003|nr:YeeE/YedE thiosulfate transporter family protein [Desulfopila inferna]MBM9604922.1 YeeE/YedE family protein [Desulfopila inferna]